MTSKQTRLTSVTKSGQAFEAVPDVNSGRFSDGKADDNNLPSKVPLAAQSSTSDVLAVAAAHSGVAKALIAKAVDTLGAANATIWLERPTTALGNKSPLSMLDSDEGAKAVECLLNQIDHGFAA